MPKMAAAGAWAGGHRISTTTPASWAIRTRARRPGAAAGAGHPTVSTITVPGTVGRASAGFKDAAPRRLVHGRSGHGHHVGPGGKGVPGDALTGIAYLRVGHHRHPFRQHAPDDLDRRQT